MRVGIISYDYAPCIGGLGRSVVSLVENLKKSDTESAFVVYSPSPSADSCKSPVARFFWSKRGGCPIFSLSLVGSLRQFVRSAHLDILHVQAGSGGVFILRKPQCRMIVTAHHTYRQEAELVYHCHTLKRLWKLWMAALERRTYRLADKVICVSADTRTEIISKYGIAAHKVCVIENSIDTQRFLKSKMTMKDGNTITYLGRLEERKGIWTLLSAFDRLRRKHPQLTLRLVGQNLLGTALDRFLSTHNLSSAVTQLKRPNDEEFLQEIQSATVVVVPSLLEGFGLVAAEAMACGTFVVASASPGLQQVITHRVTGLLFRPGDPISCAQSIEEALDSPQLRHECELRAFEEARSRFSPQRQANETLLCYQQYLTSAHLDKHSAMSG